MATRPCEAHHCSHFAFIYPGTLRYFLLLYPGDFKHFLILFAEAEKPSFEMFLKQHFLPIINRGPLEKASGTELSDYKLQMGHPSVN